MQLVTHQTGPEGQKVPAPAHRGRRRHQEGALHRAGRGRVTQTVCLMASTKAGWTSRKSRRRRRRRSTRCSWTRRRGLADADAERGRAPDRHPRGERAQGARRAAGPYRAVLGHDASLAEINPLILTGLGDVIALDAKMNFDDNALFRHPEIVAMRDLDEEDPAGGRSVQARPQLHPARRQHRLPRERRGPGDGHHWTPSSLRRRAPPTSSTWARRHHREVTEAFKSCLKNPGLKAILVNIFGGIMPPATRSPRASWPPRARCR